MMMMMIMMMIGSHTHCFKLKLISELHHCVNLNSFSTDDAAD